MTATPTAPLVDSPDAAIGAILTALAAATSKRRRSTESVPLSLAAGRVLVQGFKTDRDSPPFDTSAMDGYAASLASLNHHDQSDDRAYAVIAESRIGYAPPVVDWTRGIVRIATGAPIPAGADVVIRREDTRDEQDSVVTVSWERLASYKAGQAIRRKGENAPAGTTITAGGREITAPVSAALATFGVDRVPVFAPVRIAVITTGDELVDADQQPGPYQLRNSSGPALAALFSRREYLRTGTPSHVTDDPAALFAAASAALAKNDCLIFTGGVSMGHRDFIPALVRDLGAKVIFHKLPQRPGRPMLCAVSSNGKLIVGLPGNPQSTLITARRIVLPVLRCIAGVETSACAPSGAALAVPVLIANPDDRSIPVWWYRHVSMGEDGRVRLIDDRGSGDLVAPALSCGFVQQAPGVPLKSSEPAPFFAWDW